MRKPTVYVASPYTKGDPAINVNSQCRIFDQMMDDGLVIPYVPLWTHFQHTIFPRKYEDWIEYDKAILHLFDACLRIEASNARLNYAENRSSGADAEVAVFESINKPVFYSLSDLYDWVKGAACVGQSVGRR